MKRSLLLFASAVGLLGWSGTRAQASDISTPISWTYNFTPSQSFVKADAPGTGAVSFTTEQTKVGQNVSDVDVTNLRVSSTAAATSPDTITNAAWGVKLQLTDSASNTSQSVTFGGLLNGTFSASNSNITNTFTGQTTYSWTAPSGNVYTISVSSYTPPGPPNSSNAGSISAHITVAAPSGDPHTTSTPEPSTLILSCLGLGLTSLVTYRKRRRSLAALLA